MGKEKEIYLTSEGFLKLEEELNEAKTVRRPQIIKDLKEAKEYYRHPILGKRLSELTQLLLDLNSDDIETIIPYPDYLKLRSSMTLFYKASGNKIFMDIINKYFDGKFDQKTLELLKEKRDD